MQRKKSPALATALAVVIMCFADSNSICQQMQVRSPAATVVLDAAAQKQIVENIAGIIEKYYVFPDRGKAMADMLRTNLMNLAYSKFTNPRELGSQVIQDLQRVNPDSHLNLVYAPPNAKGFRFVSDTDTDEKKRQEVNQETANREKASNFGLSKLEILEGNVGYLRIDSFQSSPERARAAVASAMKFLENTSAIIIDVRVNPGGDPAYVALICSYFLEKNPILLDTVYNRPSNTTREIKSMENLDGPSLAGKRLYILTGPATASGAELLSYNLQSLKKATIVGGKTVGGAHEMSPYNFAGSFGNFVVIVPDGRVVNAVTKTNWEQTGVQPDLETPVEQALVSAHKQALTDILNSTADESLRQRMQTIISKLDFQQQRKQEATAASKADLSQYAGTYGERVITLEGDQLRFRRQGGSLINLVQVGNDLFELDIPLPQKPRIKFKREGDRVVGFYLQSAGNEEVFVEKK
jgi:retinol-binding protein 3